MKKNFYIILPISLLVVAFLGYLLRGAVQEWIILPSARLVWLAKGYYGAVPQAYFWMAALGLALVLILLGFGIPELESRRQRQQPELFPGSVREMSFWIQPGRSGIFPKWHVAHLLAELALDILDRRGSHQKQARMLSGEDWNPPPQVKKYLDAALTTNYTNYPKPKPYSPAPPTPFDQDLEPVIEYLESLLESDHDHHS